MGNMRRYGAPGNPETDEGREQRSGLILLRMFNDLSYDMKFVDEKRYILVSEKLCEIGRLLGGWIRSQKETSTNTGK